MNILDYIIETQIGQGAFSKVFKATKDNQIFAIKIISPPKNFDPEKVMAALRYEFWVLKDLAHPNIVQVKDFGKTDEGNIYLVEECLEGIDLKTFCQNNTFQKCKPHFINLLQVLSEIERWNIRHGDIKPENILVITKTNTVKLLDFGLITTDTASIQGTPSTMAPEIILQNPIDQRADLYSLGVTLYESLAGENPFVKKNLDQTLQAHLNFIPKSLGLIRDDIPPDWVNLIHRLLAKNPADRISNAKQALNIIQSNQFVLSPTRFVGRKKELKIITDLKPQLQINNKIAVCITGESGIGKTRFLREALYNIIGNQPELRHKINFSKKNSNTPFLLLENTKPPKTHKETKITIPAFTKNELQEWLELCLNLKDIPINFVDQIMNLTKGNPGDTWDLLVLLNKKNCLADPTGRVTKTKLKLIPWQDILSSSAESAKYQDIDWIITQIKNKLHKRQITSKHPLWSKLENLTETQDSPQKKLELRAKILSLKGETLIDENLLQQAQENLKAALEIYKTLKTNLIELLRVKNFLAYLLLRQGKTSEAVKAYESVFSEMESSLSKKDKDKITNLELGMAYLETGAFEKAHDRLQTELEQHKLSRQTAHQAICQYKLAQSCFHLNKNKEALNHYKEVLLLARKLPDPQLILRTLNGIANVQASLNQHQEALSSYDEAYELALAINDNTAAATTRLNKAKLLSDNHQHHDAIQNLKNSLALVSKSPQQNPFEKSLQCQTKTEMGKAYAYLSSKEKAKDYLNQAWQNASQDKTIDSLCFWVLLARLESWKILKEETLFQKDLAIINFYANTTEKKKKLETIKKQKNESLMASHQQSSHELSALLRINHDLIADIDLNELLNRILEHAIALTKSELGVILLEKNGELQPVQCYNTNLNPDLSDISLNIAKQTLTKGEIIKATDAIHDQNFNQYASVMALNLKSILGVPISFKGKILGVLYLSHRYRVGVFDDHITTIIKAFAEQAGLALTNHKLLQYYKDAEEKAQKELEEKEQDLIKIREQLNNLPETLRQKISNSPIITGSANLLHILRQVERVARSHIPIMIHGETGTGKELLARFAHDVSPRKNAPFIAINCGALPTNLIESELFGHKKGAFTGADRDKMGLIETAHEGTLFLDEIGDLDPSLQVKLLRALQEKEVMRLGETKARPVDVRVISATHQILKNKVNENKFREDLYFRLSGFEITLPALRERVEDIPLLAKHFLKYFNKQNKTKKPEKIAKSFLKTLTDHSWPGNIRELMNVIALGASLCDSAILSEKDLPTYLIERFNQKQNEIKPTPQIKHTNWYQPNLTWKEHEKLIFASAVIKYDYNVAQTAASLGIGTATVYQWLQKYRIKENENEWQKKILPYDEGMKLNNLQKEIFTKASERHAGHPYKAANELGVSPVTFYRWRG